MKDISPLRWPKYLAIVAAASSAVLGVAVLVGWYSHNATLLQIHPSFVAMVYNTALGFLLCGLALIAVALDRRGLALTGGIYSLLVGLLSLVEITFDKDLGIDQLLMRQYVLVANSYPGRMALNTAICWALVGVAIIGLSVPRRFRLGPLAVGVIGSITFAQGLVAFSGYLTGITTTYAWGNLTRMAVHTAFGFGALGVGLIALAWSDHRLEENKEAPRWLPIVVGVAIMAITVCLWQALVIDQLAQTKSTVEARTALLNKEMGLKIQAHMMALERTAKRWKLNGMKDEQQRKFDAALILRDYQGLELICSVDPSNHIGWTVLREQATDPGRDETLEELGSVALQRARSTGGIAVTPPVQFATGAKGFLVFIPISEGDHFEGYIGGLFYFHHLLDTVLSEELMTGYGIVISEGDDEIYRRVKSDNQAATEWANTENLSLTGMRWRITVSPEKKTLAEVQSSVSTVTLIGGLLISVILAWTVWLAQAARRRAKIVGETSQELEREIAERRLAEKALAGALEKERALFDNTLDVICSVDGQGRFVSVSPACLRLWGYRQEELIGHSYLDLVFPEDQQKTNEIAARIVKGEAVTDFVNRYLHKDGSQVHTMWSSSWSESLQLMFAVAHDVTDRVRVETALQESEQKFRSVTHSANDAIFATDSNGAIISWNQGASSMFGYLEEEILGQPLNLLMPGIYRLARLKVSRHIAKGESQVIGRTVELTGLRKNGGAFPLELSLGTWSNGSAQFYSGIVRDITERKQIAAELVKSRDEAVESARLKAEFLANMSHEIRTPMNGVIGMTGLLLETNLSSHQREYTKTIETSAEALLTIIDDILDFSKIDAGLLRFENIDFELRGDVEIAVELFAERAQAKGLELAVLVYPDVPTALRGDPGRLRQVLTNLIGNAVKFTEQGEVVISVTRVDETPSHTKLRFEVRDTGIGISPESQRILFRAFTQADGSTTRKYGGTGLGLAISKQLVELMDGEIGMESIPGTGSTFWFTAGFERQTVPAAAGAKPAANLSGAKVLIVDDNATNRNILKHQTTSWGMIATEAESGKRALDLLRASASQGELFDIALLDLVMPEMDGFELAELIKSDPAIASVALVLLPSFGKRGQAEKARQTGVAACLQKPVRQSQLYNCLTTVLAEADAQPIQVPVPTKRSEQKLELPPKVKTLSTVRILIAEDNSTNQMVALGQLHGLGYAARVVANGRALLEALEQETVDIIFMDCQMPEMDGFAATAEIRRREGALRHTTIIAMTANALEGDEARCLAAGMDDYLSKPVKADALRRKLERWTKPGALEEKHNEPSQPALRTSDSIIDQAQLASLRTIPKANFLTELIDLFLREAGSHIGALNQAVSRDDQDEVRRLAHLLKGSCANMGATQMNLLAEGLESTVSGKDPVQLMGQLEKEFQLVRVALETERQDRSDLAPLSA